MRGLRISCLVVLLLAAAPICRAQVLADRLPDDALIYFSWRGSADLGPAYQQSHLKAVMDQSEFPKLIHEAIPGLIARVSDENPAAGQILQIVTALGHPLVTHPTAFYFGGIDLTDRMHPLARVALLCDAGAEAGDMADKAMSLVEMGAANMPFKVFVKSLGTVVVISTYDVAEHPERPLGANEAFKNAMAQVTADPLMAIYLDSEKGLKQIDTLVNMSGERDAMNMWPKLRDAMGLRGMKRLAIADGFDGRDYATQYFIESPGPRTGLFALVDERPITDDFLKIIPATATMAAAGRFDMAKMSEEVWHGITTVSPPAAAVVDQYVQQFNSILGLDLQADLLAPMGSEWAAYSDPTLAGIGPLGAVVVNHPTDPAKLEASLTKLESVANNTLAGVLRFTLPYLTIEFRQQEIDGLNVHFAALPMFSPSWTMSDGYWYVGLYPQVVVSAAQNAKNSGGKSILDNPAYQDVRKRLGGPAQVNGIAFIDTPKLAPLGYQNVLLLSRLALGAGDLFGLHSPPMVVPEFSKLMPEFEPDGEITWVDAAGLHGKGLASFPGDAIFTTNNGMAASMIQMVSSLAQVGIQSHMH